jgi:hypothetical protein
MPLRNQANQGFGRFGRAYVAFMTVASLIAVSLLVTATSAEADGSGGSATLSVTSWQVDTATGQVTYDVVVAGLGTCANATNCRLSVDLGRRDATGVQKFTDDRLRQLRQRSWPSISASAATVDP